MLNLIFNTSKNIRNLVNYDYFFNNFIKYQLFKKNKYRSVSAGDESYFINATSVLRININKDNIGLWRATMIHVNSSKFDLLK